MLRMKPLLATVVVALALAGCAAPSTVRYSATLTGANEVPPTTSTGQGTAAMTLNIATKEFTWTVNYSGLSSPAIAAHIHGPAAAGANAGVLINLAPNGQTMQGSMALTDAQISQLNSGLWYINIHTVTNRGGEARGQVGFAR